MDLQIQNTVTTAAEVEQNLMVGINEENVTVKGITIFSSSKEALNHEKFAEEICLEENGDNEGKYYHTSSLFSAKLWGIEIGM